MYIRFYFQLSCPFLDCEVKEIKKSECCHVCTDSCRNPLGEIFKTNETWKENDDCIECKCVNGKKYCLTESCEPNLCSNPIKKEGICCKTCKEEENGKLRYE